MSSYIGRVVNHAWDRQAKHLTNVIYGFWELIQATHFTELRSWGEKNLTPSRSNKRVCGKGRTKGPTSPDPGLFTTPPTLLKISPPENFISPHRWKCTQNPALINFINSITTACQPLPNGKPSQPRCGRGACPSPTRCSSHSPGCRGGRRGPSFEAHLHCSSSQGGLPLALSGSLEIHQHPDIY